MSTPSLPDKTLIDPHFLKRIKSASILDTGHAAMPITHVYQYVACHAVWSGHAGHTGTYFIDLYFKATGKEHMTV